MVLVSQLYLNLVFCDKKWKLKHLCCNGLIEVGVKLNSYILQIIYRGFTDHMQTIECIGLAKDRLNIV